MLYLRSNLFSYFKIYFSSKKKIKTINVESSEMIQNVKKFKSIKLSEFDKKILPQRNKKNTLITAALPYVNNVPHLGNIIGALLSADTIARFRRLSGQNVMFICGTDQYGTATQIKAKQMKKSPKQICDQYHFLHKQIYQWFDISYNYFGRTSHQYHTQIVQQIFLECFENNLFVQKNMKQLFCKSCDMFLADRFVVGNCKSCKAFTKADQCDNCNKVFQQPQNEMENIKCSICQSEPEVRDTKHLFLNFQNNPQIKQKLNKWLYQNQRIQSWSNNAKGNTKYWLKQNNLRDRCITRDLKWGVKVPLQEFKDKVLYVWFDAPIGYISITKQLFQGNQYQKWWKKSQQYDVQFIQFMGKDNILFHSILFPSTLLSMKNKEQHICSYNLVDKMCVTEYLRYEGGKFSKSQNRGIFGNDCKNINIDSDVWRYYLLSNRPQFFDSQFSWQQFAQKNNKQLMNSIGNLYNRIFKVAYKDYITVQKSLKQIVKLQNLQEKQNNLILQFIEMYKKYIQNLSKNQIRSSCQILLETSYLLNKYVQQTQFWKNKQRKQTIISFLLRALCVYAYMIQPITPKTSSRIFYLLGLENKYVINSFELINKDFEQFFYNSLNNSEGLKQPILLFTQIPTEKIKQFSQKFGRSEAKIQSEQK